MAAAGFLLMFAAVCGRTFWLQVPLHGQFVMRAERNQEQRVLEPPVRGVILDRNGRPLSRDLITCSISAAPREMDDPAGTARQLAKTLGLKAPELLKRFQARPRFLWVRRGVPPAKGDEIVAWKRRGVYVGVEQRRDAVLGDAAVEIIGRTNLDNAGIEGLELQYDEELRGRAGWTTRFRDGRGRSIGLGRGLQRNAENGHSLVTTLDTDLQSILEAHLSRAVDTLRAVRGYGLFIDPRSGEVLACVNVPHLAPGKARNWNITDQFEPGSTFKIVVAGASLEEGTAAPDQWFEASASGQAVMVPGTVFHDVHKQAGCTFRNAVRWSSNIIMGKLGMLLGAQRLYRYAVDLGFGGMTGIEFPGEAGGKLRSPEHWTPRSTPTIAIGHELSVTPLQLALAYAAVANGGVLMRPMLVREIRDAQGTVLRRMQPGAAHRVFSEATTATLGQMLTAVVDSGTGKAARVPGLQIAGKTGTAQKFDASVGTYGRGKFVSSFAGYAPAGDPRIVGVIVIDEPRGRQHFGGEVAAPVFREVMLDLERIARGPLDISVQQVAVRPPRPAPVVVPDLRLLPESLVQARLQPLGLRVHLQGQGPRVLSQEPTAGVSIERGGSVTVWLSAPQDSASRAMPDLAGAPLREALRRLWRVDNSPRIHGDGVVVRQFPPVGAELRPAGRCELWCEPGQVQVQLPAGDGSRLALVGSASLGRTGTR